MLCIPTLWAPTASAGLPARQGPGEAIPEAVDPVETARSWTAAGFPRIHLRVTPTSDPWRATDVACEMVGRLESRVQVDAGVDDESAVHAVLAAGAEWVVIGARAADDPAWLADQSSLAPGRLLYSLDLRGWEVPGLQSRARQSRHPLELVADLESMELAGVLILAESRAGRSLDGSLDLVEDIVAASPWPVAVAGGVRGLRDLRALELRGVAAAVIEPKRLDDAPELCWLAEEFAA